VTRSMAVTRILAGVVATVAGYVSYLHIVAVATRVGERPEVAYALPVTIDALMLMSTLAMLADRRAGRRPSGWARTGFWFGVAVSVTCNIASAEPTWPARAVAAIPAVSLLLAVEVLIRASTNQPTTEPAKRSAAAAATGTVRQRSEAPSATASSRDSHGHKRGRKPRGQAITAAAAVVATHPNASIAELARKAGVSRATVRRARTNGVPIPKPMGAPKDRSDAQRP
jgi:hypothetical protein